MSNDKPASNQSEEVDLGQLFKLIGSAFDKLFSFIFSIFKSVFSVFIYSLRALFVNIKIIGITVIVAFALGYFLEKRQAPVYKSQMVVRPYYDSKFQLVSNIDYYNDLIAERNFEQLKNMFDIDLESASQLVEFEVLPGPKSENELLLEYNEFLSSIDSSKTVNITYEDYIENNETLFSGDVFEVSVVSKKRDIFKSLEEGLSKAFVSTYAYKKRQKRDSLIELDKTRIISSLEQVDSLKRVYIDVLKKESNKEQFQGPISLKDPLVQERVKTKEFELLERELQFRQELNKLESTKVEESDFFDVISGFQEVGTKYKSIYKRYSIIFPVVSLVFLIFGYLLYKLVIFTKKYEG